ncbi:hypothetical protein RFI_20311 [Reticulomyxa filosa]|uniref:Uncharacterized protein n=1 Tax=Reticulomyxa filosa TaxID=46433 RepID=X6MV93_RETFI|nr:hypothetical protein RFI_20311 [Reticulomyxa filosa]|eukprot:ETO17025.1 hypothetical protein RFI_20311 [Reticulomyxa filosa]
MRPYKRLPSNLRCEPWTTDLYSYLKSVLNSTSNVRVTVAAKADKLTVDYFLYKEKTQKYEMTELLLDIWRKIMDEVKAMIDNGVKSQTMSKMCEVMFAIISRYEWDLTHIEHWVYQDEYQPMTTQIWSKKMSRYHKQLEYTLRQVLQWIDDEKELDTGRHTFAINMLGLTCMKVGSLHKQVMGCILKEWDKKVNLAKLERYKWLATLMPKNGKLPLAWQDTYEADSSQEQDCVHSLELYFTQENPSCFMEAWKCFASDNIEVLFFFFFISVLLFSDQIYKYNSYQTIVILTARHREFVQNNAQPLIHAMYRGVSRHCHGLVNWNDSLLRLNLIYVCVAVTQTSIYVQIYMYVYMCVCVYESKWPRLGTELSTGVIKAISQLFENVPRTANQLGGFCSALLRNTDAMHPDQVQICFDTIREWIGILERDEYEPLNGLLPDTWCHETFIEATARILRQDDYQIICVLLTFILHHAHLFQDGLRLSVIRDILIKENFQQLFCHWNPVVRKYFHWVMLYTTNRIGYYDDELYTGLKETKLDTSESIQKIRITFNHVFQILNKKFFGHTCFSQLALSLFDAWFIQTEMQYSFSNRSVQPTIVSKFPVPKKEKLELKEEKEANGISHFKENHTGKEKRAEHKIGRKDERVIWRYTDMRVRQRLDTD